MYNNWIKINYIYFILIALLGVLIRFSFLGLPATYSHLLHTHSHTAFLGWIYPTLLILLINSFLDKQTIKNYKFGLQIILTQLLIFVMFVSFLVQGYGLFSILSSSIFQLGNYWFVFSFLKAVKQNPKNNVAHVSINFLKFALLALFASTFGPWSLAIIKALGFTSSEWYQMSIYFYLHFQYNGWILFALFALFFKIFENQKQLKESIFASRFFVYMAYALVPGYFLSLLGSDNNSWFFSFAAISAILQIQALYFLFKIVSSEFKLVFFTIQSLPVKIISGLVFAAYCIKTILQLLSLIPGLNTLAFSNHAIIIAFIHLVMIGVVSSFLLVLLAQKKILTFSSIISKSGLVLFYSGFIATEIILGFQFSGWAILYNAKILAFFTACLALGTIFIFHGFFKTSKSRI